MTENLLILGASVRAAAQSASRAGLNVYAADLFGDRDLQHCCQATVVAKYPAGLVQAAAAIAPCPWMYTGGLENHPDLVADISRTRPLYGNPATVLRAVRDPVQIQQALAQAGLPVPPLSRSPDGVPKDGSWLRKPYLGCGGIGIQPWLGQCTCEGHFFQQRIAGRPVAAIYLAIGHGAVLLRSGQPAHWVNVERCCGICVRGFDRSVAALCTSKRIELAEIGRVLTGSFGLEGLFGVDAVLADEEVWTIEVNPRYTASVEILERSLGCPAVALHTRACRGERVSVPETAGGNWYGKVIVYAKQDLVICSRFDAETEIADIPNIGTRISQGRPVLTVLAEAPSESTLMAKLQSRVAEIEGWLYTNAAGSRRVIR